MLILEDKIEGNGLKKTEIKEERKVKNQFIKISQ